jgi:hypothetical protein
MSEAHKWGFVGPYNSWPTTLLRWSRSHEQWLHSEITGYVPMISGIHRTSHMETSDEGKMGQVKDQLGDQRGGSEWEPIKILLQRKNSAYTPNSQPRIPTRVCQGHVVTTDLPTLGTKLQAILKRKHDSRSKGLSCPAGHLADCPQPPGGPSARTLQTVRELRRTV